MAVCHDSKNPPAFQHLTHHMKMSPNVTTYLQSIFQQLESGCATITQLFIRFPSLPTRHEQLQRVTHSVTPTAQQAHIQDNANTNISNMI
jgi:hypothetical protein